MKKPKEQGILMDLDGTLVDSKEAYMEAAETAFRTLKQETYSPEIAIEIPKRLEQGLPLDGLLEKADVQRFLRIYRDAYLHATATKTKPIPNVADTLRKLARKAKLALITMRYVPREKVVAELKSFGIADCFTYVITALDTHRPKPSPEALIQCAATLEVDGRDCVVVGDSVADIRAGKAVGAKTVAVLSGIFSRSELEREKPDLILENVNELPDFLDSLTK
ncbi:MAG: HAD family hydrolase [Candidatus Bathyarchaeota archaeon]|jgi:HAD superfamily hydrolase (TIGR01509 family)|nr:HAD family hydrolase [Candidatus Bathyarchaeota archaeon]